MILKLHNRTSLTLAGLGFILCITRGELLYGLPLGDQKRGITIDGFIAPNRPDLAPFIRGNWKIDARLTFIFHSHDARDGTRQVHKHFTLTADNRGRFRTNEWAYTDLDQPLIEITVQAPGYLPETQSLPAHRPGSFRMTFQMRPGR
jgi:hypothetical protein